VLRVVLVSSIALLAIYVLVDWAIVVPIRGSLAFGNFLWPGALPVLLFNYWLVRRGHVTLASYLLLGMISLVTLLAMYNLGTKDITVVLFAFGILLAGILVGLQKTAIFIAVDTWPLAGWPGLRCGLSQAMATPNWSTSSL
jgi:hypothetical protein